MEEDRNKKKLKDTVEKEITKMFEGILDYTQVACSSQDTFKALRSRILRSGNDCIRRLCYTLDEYDIKYKANKEAVIEIIRRH